MDNNTPFSPISGTQNDQPEDSASPPSEPLAPSAIPPLNQIPQAPDSTGYSTPSMADVNPGIPQAPESAFVAPTTPSFNQDLQSTVFDTNAMGQTNNPGVVSGQFGATKGRKSKKLMLIILAVILLGGGSAGAYFGVVLPNKPENIWKTALNRTAKGYDKLTDYATTPQKNKGTVSTSKFKLTGPIAADGAFTARNDGENGDLTGSVSAVGLKIDLDARIIKSTGNTPDIYFKVNGLQGLGSLFGFGDPKITSALNGLNNQWYVIDHSFFDQFSSGLNGNLQINKDDVKALLKTVGETNKKYLFTTDPKNEALVVKQNVGKESINGRSAYHFKVGFDKTNLKNYLASVCNNFKSSKLGKSFGGNDSGLMSSIDCKVSDKTIDGLDPSTTADAWVDMHTKLISKIRFSDKKNADNYFDITQAYTGGTNFPFTFDVHSKESDITTSLHVQFSFDTKSNNFKSSGTIKTSGGGENENGTFSMDIEPSNEKLNITKPAGAKTIIQLLNDLGLPTLFSDGTDSGAATNNNDLERQTDIDTLQSELEVYAADHNGQYPSLANLNDGNWRKTNMKNLNEEILKDPEGSASTLAATPAAHIYAYKLTKTDGTSCNSGESGCRYYDLAATLSDGSLYEQFSLNQ